MNIRQFQFDVEGWLKGDYWQNYKMFYKLNEELKELIDETVKETLDQNALGAELSDIVFASCCIANKHKLDLTDYDFIDSPKEFTSVLYLSRSVAAIGEALHQLDPTIPLKDTDEVLDLKIQLYHLVKATEQVADSYNIDMYSAWNSKFIERDKRGDKERFNKFN
jgi:NTP pyrophosphatase (non-canonical NTP hydrolase)